MAGVSGAFLLLPFQVSVLGFDSPAVSSTNHLFNVIAIPGCIYRFIKEGRMVWPLTWLVVIGTLPGVLGGALIRITYLPSPRHSNSLSAWFHGYLHHLSRRCCFFADTFLLCPLAATQQIAPDYRLGILFGIGSTLGIYLGARTQRYFSARIIKIFLAASILFTASKYLFFN